MGVANQPIKDEETEARELQSVLRSVGITLRVKSTQAGKEGITYAEFKARTLNGVGCPCQWQSVSPSLSS